MATATAKKKVVETIEGVTLELSKREADFLFTVLDGIAGAAFYRETPTSPMDTGPGTLIFKALRAAGSSRLSDIDVEYACVNFRGTEE